MSASNRVGDILAIDNEYYVRVTSGLADHRTRVLKYGDTFAVFNRFGDIAALGPLQFGLFHSESRHLSRLVLHLDGRPPLLLGSTVRQDNAFLTVDLTNIGQPIGAMPAVPGGLIHVFRSTFLESATCHQLIRLLNYGSESIPVTLTLEFEADFADIFEVRGSFRERHGQSLPARLDEQEVLLSYLGLDAVERRTRLCFSRVPERLEAFEASFRFVLAPKVEESLVVDISCERSPDTPAPERPNGELAGLTVARTLEETEVLTSSSRFNAWIARSKSDLRMLTEGNPEGAYPYAGVPWFSTVFGRDGILTAMECLWLAPAIARGVLSYLAEMQATASDLARDAEPGKIIHEMRRGEMATLGEVPFGRYYGSVDSTPLFVMLAGEYFRRTNDLEFAARLWPHVKAALSWIDDYGDADGDGYTEYHRKSERGLLHQGWKDSHDSIFHADGTIASGPIALSEVQGYVYAARRSVVELAEALGLAEEARQASLRAAELKTRFNEDFWDDALGTFVLALDGRKEPCRVRTSNAGHALFTGIATPDHARQAADTLFTPELFSGWGIRTLSSSEARYNPMSYHNGSVWPHDNALIGAGLAAYGMPERCLELLSAMYEASQEMDLHRLPELFCGFHRRGDASAPVQYPVACAPQAWAAGAVYLFLRACLGMKIDAGERCLEFENPQLPPGVSEMRILGLGIAQAKVDLLLRRHSGGVDMEVLDKVGDLEVRKLI